MPAGGQPSRGLAKPSSRVTNGRATIVKHSRGVLDFAHARADNTMTEWRRKESSNRAQTTPWVSEDLAVPRISRLGQYRLLREIGRGGMGTVYEAVQESLDRRVALKVLPPQLMKNTEFVERFKREAKAAARLHQHPNIVTIFDTGQDQGFYFYSMELVDGSSLQALIQEKGRLGIEESIGLMRQAIEGLAYAWEQNIIHRDIKPDNLMLSSRSVLKIADFGLAKARLDTESLRLTGSGSSLGTPYYMSPEQGVNARDVDHRTDIYSLGATFYHLVTGKVPFEGSSTIEVAIKVATAKFPPLREIRPEVPAGLAEVIERMLQRQTVARYQTADELMSALEVSNGGPDQVNDADDRAEREANAIVREVRSQGDPAEGRRTFVADPRSGHPSGASYLGCAEQQGDQQRQEAARRGEEDARKQVEMEQTRRVQEEQEREQESLEAARLRQEQEERLRREEEARKVYDGSGKPFRRETQSKEDDWRWHYSGWTGLCYGPIPVGVIGLVLFLIWAWLNS